MGQSKGQDFSFGKLSHAGTARQALIRVEIAHKLFAMKRIVHISLIVTMTALLTGCGNGLLGRIGLFNRNAGPVETAAAATDVGVEDVIEEDLPEAAEDVAEIATTGTLGETIASLGDPTQPGLWLETPLVQVETAGRVVTENGTSASVTLRPSGGDAGSGSRLSLAAMQALGAGLTDLVPLTVIAGA